MEALLELQVTKPNSSQFQPKGKVDHRAGQAGEGGGGLRAEKGPAPG